MTVDDFNKELAALVVRLRGEQAIYRQALEAVLNAASPPTALPERAAKLRQLEAGIERMKQSVQRKQRSFAGYGVQDALVDEMGRIVSEYDALQDRIRGDMPLG